jgi:hypothetical protein
LLRDPFCILHARASPLDRAGDALEHGDRDPPVDAAVGDAAPAGGNKKAARAWRLSGLSL